MAYVMLISLLVNMSELLSSRKGHLHVTMIHPQLVHIYYSFDHAFFILLRALARLIRVRGIS